MILVLNFKIFLKEGRDAPLYHGTRLNKLEDIIKTNTLKRGFEDSDHPGKDGKIISTTRDLYFAKRWTSNGSVIQLDQRRVSQRYKLVPFNFFNYSTKKIPYNDKKNWHFDNQMEEAITQDIKNIDNYITKIYISDYWKDIIKLGIRFPHVSGWIEKNPDKFEWYKNV